MKRVERKCRELSFENRWNFVDAVAFASAGNTNLRYRFHADDDGVTCVSMSTSVETVDDEWGQSMFDNARLEIRHGMTEGTFSFHSMLDEEEYVVMDALVVVGVESYWMRDTVNVE